MSAAKSTRLPDLERETIHQIEFRIASLRQDKIIYAVEACALNLVCLLIFFFSVNYFTGTLKGVINTLALIVAIAYTLFMGIGNTFRVLEIKRLERRVGHRRER